MPGREIFDLERFEQRLVEALQPNAVGYAYAIYQSEELLRAGGGGWAVWGEVPHSADQRQATMSMSKTITAAGVMKAIEQVSHLQRAAGVAGTDVVSIDSPIHLYLPYNWARGPFVDRITIRDLLQHTSGLRPATDDPDSYAGIAATIAAGAQASDFHKAFYANANFCLFRVLLPFMVQPKGYFIESLKNGDCDTTTANIYENYVRQNLLGPAGISETVGTEPNGAQPFTRYYDFNNTASYMVYPTDGYGTLRAGAGYWYMSAKEFGLFIGQMRAGRIISQESYQTMINALPADPDPVQQAGDRLGMWKGQSAYGVTYDHNGGYTNQQADWMAFDNGIHAVIMLNSLNRSGTPPETVVRDAFNAAWFEAPVRFV